MNELSEATVVRDIVEGLTVQSGREILQEDDDTLSVDLVVSALVDRYAAITSLHDTGDVLAAVEWCLKASSSPTSISPLVQRLINIVTEKPRDYRWHYEIGTIISSLDRLSFLALRHNVSTSFAPLFRDVVVSWADQAFARNGPDYRPPGSDILQSIREVEAGFLRCRCDDCKQVVAFLHTNVNRELEIKLDGDARKNHLQALLPRGHSLQGSVLMWETVRTSSYAPSSGIHVCTLWMASLDLHAPDGSWKCWFR